MKKLLALGLLLVSWIVPSRCIGQVMGPYLAPAVANAQTVVQPPMRLAERVAIAKPLALGPASQEARDQLDAMEAWNRNGGRPTQIGFSRSLPEPITASFGARLTQPSSDAQDEPHAVRATTGTGPVVWATTMTVQNAYALRLHLTSVELPTGSRLWVYGTEGNPINFSLDLVSPEGDLWAPTTFGDTVSLEVELPSSRLSGGFTIAEIGEVVSPLRASGIRFQPERQDAPTCLVDAACVSTGTFSSIQLAQKAVAQLQFVKSGNTFACTGTLLNDTNTSHTPYLLTANHCLPTQTEVSTLEAFWDYYDASCGGAAPDLSSLPRSIGGTLLASSSGSDFSFIRLTSVPSGRAFMGWDSNPSSVGSGVKIYRVSNPVPNEIPYPQRYSESLVDPFSSSCAGASRPNFIYSATSLGAVYGGSSGSAAILAGGYVVGQLLGACPGVADNCTQSYEATDGAFSQTYPAIAQWLNPVSGTAPVASFTFAPPSPVAGQMISFTDTSTGAPTSWSWSFGDGTSSTAQNPTKTFSTAGNYTVSLTTSNSSGSSSSSHVVTVGAAALPNLTPYQPSGWSAPIVVARAPGQLVDSASLVPTDTLYVSWAVTNNGAAATQATFYTELYVDGTLKQTWQTVPPLNPNFYTYLNDFSIGSLPAGTHTLRIKADSTNVIAESNKADNDYTKTITVQGAAPPPNTCVDSRALKTACLPKVVSFH